MRVSAQERPVLLWSFLFFFSMLCGYYLLRPVRESLIAGAGKIELPTMFTITFVGMMILVPIWGRAVSRVPRRTLVPWVFGVVVAVLGVFWLGMRSQMWENHQWFAVAFSVFISVFNLFTVSVFWSFMSDIYEPVQAKRNFAVIAAGGTAGGIAGSALTSVLGGTIGIANILLLSIAFYVLCVIAVVRLGPSARAQNLSTRSRDEGQEAIGGSPFAGATAVFQSRFLLGLSIFMFLGVSMGTMLYNMQAEFARNHFTDAAARAAFFGRVDLAINVFVILTQLTLTRWLHTRFGVAPLLLLPLTLVMLGVGAIAIWPMWAVVTTTQIITRGGNFALIQPGRESLFTIVDRETRYKAKNFIDTFIYRGADVAISWLYFFMQKAGVLMSQFAGIWFVVALLNVMVVGFVLREERKLPRANELERDQA